MNLRVTASSLRYRYGRAPLSAGYRGVSKNRNMKHEQIVALCIRLSSVAVILSAIRYVSGWLPYTDFNDMQTHDVAAMAVAVISIFVAMLLWIMPNCVVRSIVPNGFNDRAKSHWTDGEIYGCGFVVVGTYYLFKSVSGGLYWIMFLVARSRNPLIVNEPSYDEKIAILLTIAEIAASLGLILGSTGLAKQVFRVRYGGGE